MSAHPRPIPSRRPLDRRRLVAMVAVGALLAYLVQAIALPVARAEAVTVGSGSYAEGTPTGGAVPTECNNTPITNPRAHVTANFPAGAIPTNDWWTSLLWRKFNCASVSENLMAHPLAFHAFTNGLGVSYPTTASISGTATGVGEYHYPYAEDFRLGIAGLDARRQGRRLLRLDRQRATGPTAAAACAPRSATACRSSTRRRPAATRRSRARPPRRCGATPTRRSASRSTGTTTSRTRPTGSTWSVSRQHDQLVAERRDLLLRRRAAHHAEQQQRRPRRRAERATRRTRTTT